VITTIRIYVPVPKEEKMTGTGSHADTRDMYMVHTAFRREFGALPNLVRNVEAGNAQRSQIIGDHFEIRP
jgi:hypothetical protein